MKWELILLRLHFGNGLELKLVIALATQVWSLQEGEVTTSDSRGSIALTNDNKMEVVDLPNFSKG
jgi:hypothetical protein